MIKAILFDFDGTLANTAPGIVCTMKETFRNLGLPIPDDEAVRQTIGLPLVDCVRILGKLDPAAAAAGADVYRSLFPTFELQYITMYPEVADTVKALAARGIRMAICTSRGHDSLQRILERYGLWECFETAVTASDNLTPKPAPDMVNVLLERMGLKPDDALVVGDTTFDIEMGNAALCRTVAVTYGNHSRAQLASVRPTFTIDNFSELKYLVMTANN